MSNIGSASLGGRRFPAAFPVVIAILFFGVALALLISTGLGRVAEAPNLPAEIAPATTKKPLEILASYYPVPQPGESPTPNLCRRPDGGFEAPGPWPAEACDPVSAEAARVAPVFPENFGGTTEIYSWNAKTSIRSLDARHSVAELAPDGSLVYPGALAGGDVVYRYTPERTEEFIILRETSDATPSFMWELDLGSGSGRLTPKLTAGGTVELHDAKGAARFRIDAPQGKDSAGKALLPGRELSFKLEQVIGDKAYLSLHAELRGCVYPVVIDPSWSSTGSMAYGRDASSCPNPVVLVNGKVLMAGGLIAGVPSALCELYDPGTGTWAATGSMAQARYSHLMGPLPNGQALVAGGILGISQFTNTCEIFDPTDETWKATDSLPVQGYGSMALLLPTGKLLTYAGSAAGGLFNPVDGTWDFGHGPGGGQIQATELADGTILSAGGTQSYLYNPFADTGTNQGNLQIQIQGDTPSLAALPNGNAILIGGYANNNGGATATCELFNRSTGQWSFTGTLPGSRFGLGATNLNDGKVLAVGGGFGLGTPSQTSEEYNPSTGTWGSNGNTFAARIYPCVTRLASGKVLLVGGQNSLGRTLASAELYNDSGPNAARQYLTTPQDQAVGVTLSGNDPGNSSLIYNITLGPLHGTLSGTAPNLTYTPNSGFVGYERIAFTVTNVGALTSVPAHVWIGVGQVDNPRFSLLTPQSGETLYVGRLYDIKWSAHEVGLANIELSRDGGTTWESILSNVQASATHATWTVTGPASYSASLRVRDAVNGNTLSQVDGLSVLPEPYKDTGISIPGFSLGQAAWGDYDGDGFLDLIITGYTGIDPTPFDTLLYHNNGDGTFTPVANPFPKLSRSSVAWGDYNNDGKLDLAICGLAGDGTLHTQIFRNDGSGNFTDIGAGLPGVMEGKVAWADMDNDGRLDLCVMGRTVNGANIATFRIYHNDGNDIFSDANAGITGTYNGDFAIGDFNNDGNLDVAVVGQTGSGPVAYLYRNDGGTFTPIPLPGNLNITAVSSVAWGDYDNDGYLDLLLAGNLATSFLSSGRSGAVILHNQAGSGTFTTVQTAVPALSNAVCQWGDFDNDGVLDLFVSGQVIYGVNGPGPNWPPDGSAYSRIQKGDGIGNFADSSASITQTSSGGLARGDFDNDGDLDLVAIGLSDPNNGNSGTTKIYRNDMQSAHPNQAPGAPGSLGSSVTPRSRGVARGGAVARGGSTKGDLTMTWGASSDQETSSGGLNYNVRVGSSPGLSDVFTGMAANSGLRKLPAIGNSQANLTWTLKNLPKGIYYWSVQAIDTGFAGSPWAPEQVAGVVTPAANNDTYWVAQDGSLSIAVPQGVLANDKDNGTELSANTLTTTTHGTLSFNADGSFDYTPNAGYFGLDSFTYEAGDGTDTSNTATVSIYVDPPPDLGSGPFALINPVLLPAQGLVQVLASDAVPGPNPLTFNWTQSSGPGTATFVTPNSYSSLVNFSAPGSYDLQVLVSDGLTSSSGIVTITVLQLSGANDLNYMLNAGAFKLDWSHHKTGNHNVDALTLTGQLNPHGLPASLNGVKAELLLNGQLIGGGHILNASGMSVNAATPGWSYLVNARTGNFTFRLANLDLRTSIGLSGGLNQVGQTNLGLVIRLSGGALGAPVDYSGVFSFRYGTTANVVTNGTYNFLTAPGGSGVFVAATASALQSLNGHFLALQGTFRPNGGGALTPNGPITIQAGNATITIPLAKLQKAGSAYVYVPGATPIANLRAFRFDNATHTFSITTNALPSAGGSGTGIPLRGAPGISFSLNLQMSVATASGSVDFQTAVQLYRATILAANWAH